MKVEMACKLTKPQTTSLVINVYSFFFYKAVRKSTAIAKLLEIGLPIIRCGAIKANINGAIV